MHICQTSHSLRGTSQTVGNFGFGVLCLLPAGETMSIGGIPTDSWVQKLRHLTRSDEVGRRVALSC